MEVFHLLKMWTESLMSYHVRCQGPGDKKDKLHFIGGHKQESSNKINSNSDGSAKKVDKDQGMERGWNRGMDNRDRMDPEGLQEKMTLEWSSGIRKHPEENLHRHQ